MKIKYNYEIIAGGIFAVIAFIMLLMIPSQIQTLEKSTINAATVPGMAIGGLFIFSVLLFIQGLMGEKKEITVDNAFFNNESVKKEMRTCFFALLLIVYGVMFGILGYIIDTVILVSAILAYYGCRKWLYYVISIAAVFIAYLVFSYILNVNLPTLFL